MDAVDYTNWTREDFALEIMRLQALFDGRFRDARLLAAAPDGKGAFVLDIQTGLSGILAENMLAILKGEGAPNFVQVEANHPEAGLLTFTVERRVGRSPAVQLAEAKSRMAALEASLAKVVGHAWYPDDKQKHDEVARDVTEAQDLLVTAEPR